MKYSTPKGTRDFLPPEMAKRNYVRSKIVDIFERYGFQEIQTPVFEEFDLFAARSGEEIREHMFTFSTDEKEYVLRPELTAAVCRVISSGKMNIPKPYKIYYIGQCYRYEQPQAGRYREFWQAGLEYMGSTNAICDAEVMAIASRVIRELGIENHLLKVGNVGIFRDLLTDLGYDDERQNYLISNIDSIMSLREKCEVLLDYGEIDNNVINFVKGKLGDLYQLQEETNYEGEYEIFPDSDYSTEKIKHWLNVLPDVMENTYRESWINKGYDPKIVELFIKISHIRGKKEKVLNTAKELLVNTKAEKALNDLIDVLNWLDTYKVPNYEVVLGVARGLDFYTGTVFEFDCPLLGAEKQICGGGRYDKLVEEFDGPHTPATGYAFGMDRLVIAMEKSENVLKVRNAIDAFIVTFSNDQKSKAIQIAEELRAQGKKVEFDTLNLDIKGQMGYASDRFAKYSIILGPDELKDGKVSLKDMESKTQKALEIEKVVDEIGKGEK